MFRLIRALPVFLLLWSLKTPSMACAVCFGNTGGNWIQGFTWGVAFLVLLPFLMMVGFVAWIATTIRRNARRAQSIPRPL